MGLGAVPTTRNWKFLKLPAGSTVLEGVAGVTSGAMLNSGTMEFYNASDEQGAKIEIAGFVFKEWDTNATPALQKCPFRVHFFRKCSVATASGTALVFTQAMLEDWVGCVDIEAADYIDLEGGAGAIAQVWLEKPIELDIDLNVVQCVAVAKGAKTFTVTHVLIPELIVAE